MRRTACIPPLPCRGLRTAAASTVLLTLLLLAVPAVAQIDFAPDDTWHTGAARWTVSAATAYHGGAGAAYASTRLGLTFRQGGVQAGARVHLNEQLNFTFAPGDLVIHVDGEPGPFREDTRFAARPDRYTLAVPADAFVTYQHGRLGMTGLVSIMTQEAEVEVPEPQVADDGFFVINWRQRAPRQHRLTGAVVGRLRWRGTTLAAGALALPLQRFGDGAVPHGYRPHVRPYMAAEVDVGTSAFAARTTLHHAALAFAQTLPHPWRNGTFRGRLLYETGLDAHAYHALHLDLDVPLSRRLDAVLTVAQTWAPQDALDPAAFEAWQQTLAPHGTSTFHHGLPHTLVQAGLRLRLGHQAAPAIELHDFDLHQDHFYGANRAFYARNPIGTVALYNGSRVPVRTRLLVETTDTGGRYQSEPVDLAPGEERRLPLFLYLGELNAPSRHEQIVVSAATSAHTTVLASAAVVTHGPNAWDGDTWSLRYFVAPEDPDVRQRAKRLFLETHLEARTDTEAEAGTDAARQYAHLRHFLDALGHGLAYVEDPTTTRVLDRVQYPVETLREGGGDCEDLTVYLASSLMAVGIDAAVVDVRPVLPAEAAAPTAAPGAIGHVFLLVDTGVDASQLSTLGLNEFQGLTRRSADGRTTVWVPVETSILRDGFEAAHREGVRQYYRAVFRDDGVTTGRVRVYDF